MLMGVLHEYIVLYLVLRLVNYLLSRNVEYLNTLVLQIA